MRAKTSSLLAAGFVVVAAGCAARNPSVPAASPTAEPTPPGPASTGDAEAAPAVGAAGDADPVAAVSVAVATGSGPCSAGVRRQFDFWIGSWEVTNPEGVQVGTNRIEAAQNGCVLTEHWTSARGQKGTSLNFYSARDEQWVQVWLDSQGGWLEMRGGLDGAAMVLQGEYSNADGSSYLLRGRWTPNADGTVRQLFESSKDGGATWATWFDGTYRRR